jgi:exodeoxyribonuclease VII large subunit
MLNLDVSYADNTHFHSDEIYSVTEFLNSLNRLLSNNVPMLWISGEVSNLSTPKSGHIYFSLKDDTAVIRCALFRLSARKLKFNLENGLKVMVYASLSVYETRGDMQLIVGSVEPVGIGSSHLALKQLKEKLYKEGLFATKYKKPIPKTPKKIGLITSKTGAVVQDIIKVLGVRYPYAELFIYDVNTQGEMALSQISHALGVADNASLDTIIIARGGGSSEDLFIFNDEALARQVFNAKTPIISSIGHEIDKTILDFVADKTASTPSAAAMFAVPDRFDLIKYNNESKIRLTNIITNKISLKNKYLNDLISRVLTPKLTNYNKTLSNYEQRLNNLIQTKIGLEREKLGHGYNLLLQYSPAQQIDNQQKINKIYQEKLLKITTDIIDKRQTKFDNLNDILNKIMQNIISKQEINLTKNITALEHLSPLKVLSRGYSISFHNNKAITKTNDIEIGDEITTQVRDGKFKSKVIK